MRIAISATRASLDAFVDEQFGRCPSFVIVDQQGTLYDLVDNPYGDLGSGAWIQAARLLVRRGVAVVLTGQCGPEASETLAAADVRVVTGCSGTVRQALEEFASGLDRSSAVTSESFTPAVEATADFAKPSDRPGRWGRRIGRQIGGDAGGGFESGGAGGWSWRGFPGI